MGPYQIIYHKCHLKFSGNKNKNSHCIENQNISQQMCFSWDIQTLHFLEADLAGWSTAQPPAVRPVSWGQLTSWSTTDNYWIICLSSCLGVVHMHVVCESHQSQRDSLSGSSAAQRKHDVQACCWFSTVGNPIFGTEHKHSHFATTQNQRQTRGEPIDVLCWCVAAGGQPGGWNQSWTVWSINRKQSPRATVKLVYTVFSHMKGWSHNDFNPNPRS